MPNRRDDIEDPRIEQLERDKQALTDRLERLVELVKQMRGDGPSNPGMFLIIIVFLILGRVAILLFAHDVSVSEARISSLVVGAVSLWMLEEWLRLEWKALRCLIIPRGVVIAASARIAYSLLGTNPAAATALAVAALLIAVSPICSLLIGWAVGFLSDPKGAIHGRKQDAGDAT